jgi:hypothetical protein
MAIIISKALLMSYAHDACIGIIGMIGIPYNII